MASLPVRREDASSGSTTLTDEVAGLKSVSWASRTDIGLKRDHNEDSVLAMQRAESAGCLLLVADGMGGHVNGEQASADALAHVQRLYGGGRLGDSKSLIAAFDQIDRMLHKNLDGGGTTLVLAIIEDSSLTVANVGDSRAYLLRSHSLKQLTEDDSWVQSQVRSGHLTEDQARGHPRRNVLIKALGPGREEGAGIVNLRFFPGDIVMLCSDGLHGVVADAIIEDVLRRPLSLEHMCCELIRLAISAGGPDNISVAICRSDED